MATSLNRAYLERSPISEIGSALSGRFLVLNSIKTMGNVTYYRAREYQEKKEVVLKIPTGDATAKTLFTLQASAAARLSHENIARESGPEELNGVLFTVGDVSPATETLRSLLDRKGWLRIDEVIDIGCQIALALDHAHNAGVVHLMLQPEHILIGEDNAVLISEFGAEENPDQAWVFSLRSKLCPAQYQSPEQVDNTIVDHRSDLYTLGVIMFEMLTDRLPFDSTDPLLIRERRLRQSPMSPHILFPELPRTLSNVVLCLLDSNQNKRFQNASEVLAALQQMLQSEPKLGEHNEELSQGFRTETEEAVDQASTAPAQIMIADSTDRSKAFSSQRSISHPAKPSSVEQLPRATQRIKSGNSYADQYTKKQTMAAKVISHPGTLMVLFVLACIVAIVILVNVTGVHP
ncbi:MAG TPA: serine/threonine-protein kinase [Blastocatellia bacterium]|nr:serine/threonine-protein kinase [Blastocatellia bacterium]